VRALIEEAELTPKPALVDGREGGAQEDLSVFLMRRSAHCLAPFFELIALTSLEQIPTQTLREELGTIGRWAEHFMLRSTRRINTHQGAIWLLGLLLSAAAMGAASVEAIAETARQLACLPDRNASKKESHGLQVARPYRPRGARAEAQAGFPSIIAAGLPRLHLSRQIDRARLQRLQPGIDRLDGAVDGPADMRDHQPLHRPLHRQSHAAVEERLCLVIQRGGFGEVAQYVDVDMLSTALGQDCVNWADGFNYAGRRTALPVATTMPNRSRPRRRPSDIAGLGRLFCCSEERANRITNAKVRNRLLGVTAVKEFPQE
jgi:hypothetical protein